MSMREDQVADIYMRLKRHQEMLKKCQDARQREHDLRVKFQGELEETTNLLIDACLILDDLVCGNEVRGYDLAIAENIVKRVVDLEPGANWPSKSPQQSRGDT